MKVEYISIQCSMTPDSSQKTKAKQIDRLHIEHGYGKIGFHFVVGRDGWIELGRMEHENGAHQPGFNTRALGICLVGTSEFPEQQMAALAVLVRALLLRYPRAVIQGSKDFNPNQDSNNPPFSVKEWWERIQ